MRNIDEWLGKHPVAHYLLLVCLVGLMRGIMSWCSGNPAWQDGNLLVSGVFSVLMAAGLFAGDRLRRKNEKTRKKWKETLNKKENNGL